ncbi:MAG: hypothetical protein LBG19_01505 [Prevotellaceae bacterium]|jgi:alanine dehydrogenase|nr:hypothetical protein [Prevotellaceae bacterium]
MENTNQSYLDEQGNPLILEEMEEVHHSKKHFSIGVPKESVDKEQRVSLTPDSVEILVKLGIEVIVQDGAGEAAGYTNEAYLKSGAKISVSAIDVFCSDVIVKVAFPERLEVGLMHEHSLLFSYIYCDTPQAIATMKSMAEKKITAIAFERITDDSGLAPIQKTLEQIAGKTAILVAAELLSTWHGGKGLLLCEVPGIEPLKVLVLGSGTIADAAAKTATSLGVSVTVLGTPPNRLGELGQIPITGMLYSGNLSKHLESADVVIGAVDPMDGDQFSIDDDMIMRMKKGAVIVDVLADKGGCFSSTSSQPLESPIYEKHGVIHFCVSNITSLAAHTASAAISNMLMPVLLKLVRVGSAIQLLKEEPGICNGTYLLKGIHTNLHIAKQHGTTAQNINILLKAF